MPSSNSTPAAFVPPDQDVSGRQRLTPGAGEKDYFGFDV
jgi:hypothetical protein